MGRGQAVPRRSGCGIPTWYEHDVGMGVVCSENCYVHSNWTTCTGIQPHDDMTHCSTNIYHVTCCTTFMPHVSHMLMLHVTQYYHMYYLHATAHATVICYATSMPHVPHVTVACTMFRSMDLLDFNCEWSEVARHTGQGNEPSALEGLLDTHTAQNLAAIHIIHTSVQSVVLTCAHIHAQKQDM